MKRRRAAAVAAALVIALVGGGFAARTVSGAAPSPSGSAAPGGLGVITEVMHLIFNEYNGKVTVSDLIKGAVRGMLDALKDPYSYYLDPEEYRRFNEEMQGFFGGIGVMVESQEGHIVIVSVLPGTPADQAGIQPGDLILSAEGKSLEGAAVEEAVRLIRGEPGTEVRLLIGRKGVSPFELRLKRAVIDIPSIDTRYMEGGIGYIRLNQFSGNVAEQFRFIYDRFVSIGAKGIIVDLRNNPGGYLDQAVAISQLLVPKGPIVHVEDNRGGKVTIDTIPHKPGPPLVILVNEGSASASEIVAAAVKENRAGTVVGTRTYGKGTVQTVIELQNGGAVRITTARYLTPSGASIEGKGLEPDVVVEEADGSYHPPEFAPLGNRTLRRGMIGLDVLGVQQRLSFLGYDPGAADGILGQRTMAAILAFQRSAGVKEAGFGPKTAAALESAVGERVTARRSSAQDLPLAKAVEIITKSADAARTAGAGG